MAAKPWATTSMKTAFGLMALAFLVTGCGDGSPKVYTVKGAVTYNGKPLPKGVIYFNPDPRKGNDGPQGHALIIDGQYTTEGPMGKGVVGGSFVVRIEGFDGKPGSELPMGKPIFTDYTETRDFAAAAQEQNFEIKK
ncbi:hypothetical protein BH11PLA2_BH11PLA2_49320 [soil metagenome]